MSSQSSLQTLYTWSLNLNNMIGLSLMKDPSSKFNKIFTFFNSIPGVRKEDGNRTYEFKSGINYKLVPSKLFEISSVINAYVRGQGKMLGHYGIINDTSKSNTFGGGNGGMKSLYFNYVPADEEKNKGIPGIMIVSKFGDKGVSTYVPAPSALALAEACKIIFERAMQLDMEEFANNPSYSDRGSSFSEGSSKTSGDSVPHSGSESGFPSFSNEEVPF